MRAPSWYGFPCRTYVASPKPEGKYPGILLYSEIFQLTGPISYDPSVSAILSNNSSGTGSPDYRIVPLQFTLVF